MHTKRIGKRYKIEKLIKYNNQQENAKHVKHTYHIGDMVLMQRTDSTRKLERPYNGPYEITEVFTNGLLAIQKGIVNNCVNIRRTFPYWQKSNLGSECNVLIGSIGLDQPNSIGLGLYIYNQLIGSIGLDQSNSIGLGLYIGSIGLDHREFYGIRTTAGIEST